MCGAKAFLIGTLDGNCVLRPDVLREHTDWMDERVDTWAKSHREQIERLRETHWLIESWETALDSVQTASSYLSDLLGQDNE